MRIELVHTVNPDVAKVILSFMETIVAEERLPASVTVNEDENLEYSVSTAIRVHGPAGEELTMPLYGHVISADDLDRIRDFICRAWQEFTLTPILHVHGRTQIAA